MLTNNKDLLLEYLQDQSVESKMMNLGGGKWQCTDCGYQSQSCNVKKHVESKHLVPYEYSCKYCDKVLRGRHAYNNHVYSVHKTM